MGARAIALRLALPACLASALPFPGLAQDAGAVAGRNLPAGTILSATDIASGPGAGIDPAAALGLQTRVAVYAGRPIEAGNLSAPDLVSRNQVVTLRYERGGLTIETEGRALGSGSAGATVRVMNLSSRAMLNARVNADGSLSVAERQN